MGKSDLDFTKLELSTQHQEIQILKPIKQPKQEMLIVDLSYTAVSHSRHIVNITDQKSKIVLKPVQFAPLNSVQQSRTPNQHKYMPGYRVLRKLYGH